MNIIVGNKLKILRKDKDLSQEEVADFLNISQSAYARMESGESHSWANHILKICAIFDILPEDLLKMDTIGGKENRKEKAVKVNVFQLSDKVIEQYDERIKELKKTIKDLKKEMKVS